MDENKIKRNFLNSFFSFGGTIFPKGINLISIPILVRILSTSEYGKVNVFTTYVSIFAIIIGMDFAVAVGKGVIEFEKDKYRFMSVGMTATLIMLLLSLVMVNLFPETFSAISHYTQIQLNVLVLYAYATFLVLFKSVELIYSRKYAKNFFLNAFVSTMSLIVSVAFIVTLFKDDRFNGRIIGAALPAVIVAVVLFLDIARKGMKLFDKKYLKYFVLMGIPLIPHSLAQFILGNADKIMIENMISPAKSGVYSLVATLGLVMTAITEAVNNLWNPWMFRKLDKGQNETVMKMYYPYILLFSGLSILVAGISPEIVKIIGTSDYYEGLNYCVWMTLSAYLLFLCNKYVDLQYYEKKTYFVSIGTVSAALINIGLNLLFLKTIGYEFAVISTLVSYTILVFLYMFFVNVVIKQRLINSVFVIVNILCMYLMTFCIQKLAYHVALRLLVSVMFAVLYAVTAMFVWRKRDRGTTSDKGNI